MIYSLGLCLKVISPYQDSYFQHSPNYYQTINEQYYIVSSIYRALYITTSCLVLLLYFIYTIFNLSCSHSKTNQTL